MSRFTRSLATLAVAVATVALTACGGSPTSPSSGTAAPSEALTTVKVGASPVPHARILEYVKNNLAQAAGLDLQIVEFDDYVQPNEALASKELDANYFQHLPYLEDFNAQNNTHIVSVGGIHVEPMGLYGGKQTSLDALTK